MAIRLVRANSDTPNIQNYDDARMLRFATGGQNGVIKGYKNECSYNSSSYAIFKINPGEIIIDGWQSEIDATGYEVNLEVSSTPLYYSIFAVVDLRTSNNQLSKIEAFYDTTLYDWGKPKEDLSNNPFGQHYLLLYTFKVVNGAVSEIDRRFDLVEYNKDIINNLETRLGDRINKIGSTISTPVNYASRAFSSEEVDKTDFSGIFQQATIGSGANVPSLTATGIYLIEARFVLYDIVYNMVGMVRHITTRSSLLVLSTGKRYNDIDVRVLITVNELGVISAEASSPIESLSIWYLKIN